jgi:hypothetical protein
VKRASGLFALLALAILAVVAVVGVTRPVRVLSPPPGGSTTAAAAAPTPGDAGTLDSLLDAIHVEHGMQHGR